VQTLLQTGAFSAESTELVAAPLAFLAAGLISYALVEAFARAFYAMHDTRTPVVTGLAIIVLNIVVAIALLGQMGYLALALALSASTTVEAVILGLVLRHRLGALSRVTWTWLGRVLAAGAVTGLVAALLALPLTEATTPGNGPRLQQIIVFVIALGVVGAVYVGCAWILRVPELSQSLHQISRRLPVLHRFATPLRD
jgi:putative peptidoglycan lipid II flippase